MPKKKIALINPKNPLREGASLGSLSLATNAAFIPDNYDVVVVNQASGEKIPRDTKLAAITVNTVTARNAYNLSEELRRAGIPTVFGGVHPSVQTEEARKYASAVVVGEGETVWDQLLDDFETGKLEGKLYTPGSFDMAESRLPRRELMGQPFMNTLQTSRGCPLGCAFLLNLLIYLQLVIFVQLLIYMDLNINTSRLNWSKRNWLRLRGGESFW